MAWLRTFINKNPKTWQFNKNLKHYFSERAIRTRELMSNWSGKLLKVLPTFIWPFLQKIKWWSSTTKLSRKGNHDIYWVMIQEANYSKGDWWGSLNFVWWGEVTFCLVKKSFNLWIENFNVRDSFIQKIELCLIEIKVS